MIQRTGIDQQEINIIYNFYWHQIADVRVEQATTCGDKRRVRKLILIRYADDTVIMADNIIPC